MFKEIVDFIKTQFPNKEFIPLHEPLFNGNEKKYINDCIDSTYVSSVGKYVGQFEEMLCDYTGAKNAVSVVNGTNALHLALLLVGVKQNDEVLTQPLSFIATSNAINYCNAIPHFVDVDKETLSLSPSILKQHLEKIAIVKDGICYNGKTNNRISACLPMHSFGLPGYIDELIEVCNQYNIPVVEDAAESLGSTYKGKHTGTFGRIGVFSLNGNKTITSGGGGAIITNDEVIAKKAKHLTTQAKVPHKWRYVHDHIGYNYRMPNINAALACAQLEQIDAFVNSKRSLAHTYQEFFSANSVDFVGEQKEAKSNYWLNIILLKDKEEREKFLEYTNDNGVMTRPIWDLINKSSMFVDCPRGDLSNSQWLEDRVVNIPSSARI